jgi:MFS family permease
MTLGGGIITDLFPVEQRGTAMAIFTIGPLIGPSLGPIIGAFVAQSIGWRWDAWLVFIPGVLITAALAIFLPETNPRVLIDGKVKRLRKHMNRPGLESCYVTPESRGTSQTTIIMQGLMRPLKMLFLAPMITIISSYVAFLYGTVYLMYNTIPIVCEYHLLVPL